MAESIAGAAPLRRIAVVGGGQVALLAAIAVARALPGGGVTLVPAPVSPAALADQAHTTMSGITALHARLGIAEALLLTRTGACHRLAIQYRGWWGRPPFSVGQGAAARDAAGGFLATPSLAAALAEAERFCPADEALGAELDPVLRWDPTAYRAGLTALARSAGVAFAPASLAASGHEASGDGHRLGLADGGRVEAELVIDASGPAALVHSEGNGRSRIDWAGASPIDRLCGLCAPVPGAPVPSLTDAAIWRDGGYALMSPGRDGTRWWLGWSSATASVEQSRARLAAVSGGTPGEVVALRPGRVAEPWLDRVIAIGDAAVTFEPLGWANLHLAACQILLLLELLPSSDHADAARAEYNRRATQLAERVHDFVAAHHRNGIASPTLAQRRDQFAHRGWLPAAEDDSVPADLWAQLLSGQGVGPGSLPRLLALTPAQREAAELKHHREIERAVGATPLYKKWLARERRA